VRLQKAHYRLPPSGLSGVPLWLWLAKGEAAAAIVFGFSFLGFFASRLPRFSPLAIASLPRRSGAGVGG
jgi:hypothetical protein